MLFTPPPPAGSFRGRSIHRGAESWENPSALFPLPLPLPLPMPFSSSGPPRPSARLPEERGAQDERGGPEGENRQLAEHELGLALHAAVQKVVPERHGDDDQAEELEQSAEGGQEVRSPRRGVSAPAGRAGGVK